MPPGWPRIRQRAYNAFIGNREDGETAVAELERLLSDVNAGAVQDADDDLLGCLLTELYPERLSTPEVLQYLRTPKAASYFGMYEAFWTLRIPESRRTLNSPNLWTRLSCNSTG